MVQVRQVIRTPYVHRWQLPALAVCVPLRMRCGHIVGAGLRLSAHPTFTGGSCLQWLYVSCYECIVVISLVQVSDYPHTLRTPVAAACSGCMYPAKNALWSISLVQVSDYQRTLRSPVAAACSGCMCPAKNALWSISLVQVSDYQRTLRTTVTAACSDCMCPAKNALWSYRWCRSCYPRTLRTLVTAVPP